MLWAAVLALSACGGGGDAGSSGENHPTTPTYSAEPVSVGDYFTHRSTTKQSGYSAEPSYATSTVREARGGSVFVEVGSSFLRADQHYDAERRLAKTTYPEDGGECVTTYLPARIQALPKRVTVGMSWEQNSVAKTVCPNRSAESTFVKKTIAEALESITLPIGTFTAIRTVSSIVSESATRSLKTDVTCWVDPALGVDLKCSATRTTTNKSNGSVTKGTYETELVAYASAKAGRRFDSVSRFAGTWSGVSRVSGDVDISCKVKVAIDGKFTADCPGWGDKDGTVGQDGAIKFWVGSILYLTDFVGKLESPYQASGTVTMDNRFGAPRKGAWVLTHD